MSRNGFISDNLYDMRDRLKRNYEERQHSGAAPDTPEPSQDTPVAAPRKPQPDIQTKEERSVISSLPQLSSSRDNDDAAREARDLEGRLLRDCSFADADAGYLKSYHAALEDFRTSVEELLTELRSLDKEHLHPAEYAKKVDHLRLKYFHAYGKFDAVRSHRSTTSSPESSDLKVTMPSQWYLVAGIIAASLIVSLTLIFIFG
ncbi:MAG: hypothetical protein IKC89_00635 [Lentisphaeria bacterium]|nr:hypothetical protein [Lentisphaeria bacterium]